MEKTNKKTKAKGKKLSRDQIFMLVIAIVVVAAIVVGIVVLTNNKKNEENNIDNNNQGTVQGNNEENTNNGEQDNTLIDMENKENVEVSDGNKTNNSNALKTEKTYAGMKVKDIKLGTDASGMVNFTATVENTSGKDFKAQKIKIIFTNKDGSEFAQLESYLGDINTGKTSTIDASTTADITNAYDFKIESNE